MEEDTKVVLMAWRELVIENQRLRDELKELSNGIDTKRSVNFCVTGHWFFPSRRDRGINISDVVRLEV